MAKQTISIDRLIEIVQKGGIVRTGVDIYSHTDTLLLEKSTPVSDVRVLETIKTQGILELSFNPQAKGGIWNRNGKPVALKPPAPPPSKPQATSSTSDVERRIQEINELRQEASRKYQAAREKIKEVIAERKRTGGEFDYVQVESTVTELFDFLTKNEGAFSYLTKEIFTYDNYLYNHSINVCTIGTAAMKGFNDRLLDENDTLSVGLNGSGSDIEVVPSECTFPCYTPKELLDISVGFFLHDVGKVLIPDAILNKTGQLTKLEYDIVKPHHSALYEGEKSCYPEKLGHTRNPDYVKFCKLSDIYDAMTAKSPFGCRLMCMIFCLPI